MLKNASERSDGRISVGPVEPPAMIDLTVVLVSWNVIALLRDCLNSIAAGVGELTHEIVVVDNASTDGSADLVATEFPNVKLIRNQGNVGFARANNQGIAIGSGRCVLLLNSDTLVRPDALIELVAFMDQHARVGAVCPRLVLPGGEPQAFAFGGDPSIGHLMKRGLYRMLLRRSVHNWRTDQVQAVDWVSGACLLVRRAVIDQVGGLDENIFMYFEDADWCKRIREAGWRVMFNPQIEIVHLGGQSLAQNPAAREAYDRSLRYFYGKHYGPLARLLLGLFLTFYRSRSNAA
jgi:N-acetylglucosaminyl-diphospho-decaprenol L-rhamnosyltransferase